MKIFNTENGVKKVYVQINDIFTVQELDDDVPLYVYDAALNNEDASIDKHYGMGFVEFTRPVELEFFTNNDWIIDYKKFKYSTIKQLEEFKVSVQKEIDEIYNSVYKLSMEERKSKQKEISRIYLLNYEKGYIDQLIAYKKGKLNIELPLVPDSDSFSFSGDREFPYELKPALDANKVLVYRKDGKPLEDDEHIPEEFIKKGMTIIMAFRRSIYKEDDYSVTSYRSVDKEYFVIEFVKKKELEDKKEEKGIMKLVHKFVNKKN